MASFPNTLQPKNDIQSSGFDPANRGTGRSQPESNPVAEKAKDVAFAAADKAKEVASAVAQTAGDAASTLSKKAEDATAAVGSGMKTLAGTIHEKGPHGGVTGRASDSVADALEGGGRYLEEHGLKGIGDDLTDLIRRNPVATLLAGIGIGYLIARATSRNLS